MVYNIIRQNNINMGRNGENTLSHKAGRIWLVESDKEYPGVHQTGRGCQGSKQTEPSFGQTRLSVPEIGRIYKYPKGSLKKFI